MSSNDILSSLGRTTFSIDYEFKEFLIRSSSHLLFPEVVENPKNQSAFVGSNVTFNCTAMGLPTPVISWMKNNDLCAVTSNMRARVVPENKSNHSQLIITEVKMEDNGKYKCVASNSAGEKTSSAAFLYIKELGKTPLHCWKS